MQQQLFRCKNCGSDLLTKPHRPGCQLAEQTVLKCQELGMNPPPMYRRIVHDVGDP